MRRREWFLGKVATPLDLFEQGAVGIEGDRIFYVGEAQTAPRSPQEPARTFNGWITPGMVDVHVHGGGGGSILEGTPEAVIQASRALVAHGVTSFLATTVTGEDLSRCRHLEVAAETAQRPPDDGAKILGIHVEGPYVNMARHNMIHPSRVWPPERKSFEGLLKLMQGKLKMMTIAPELPGALDLIQHLKENGVVASLGHTEATLEEARAGFAAGIQHVTHLYNAMQGLSHREPGALGAVLMDHAVTAQIIADGVHVHPDLLRWTCRVLSPERLVLMTDGLPSSGLPQGEGEYEGEPYTVVDGAAWSKGGAAKGKLIGTTLALDQMVVRAMRFMGVDFPQAVAMASLYPARALGMTHEVGSLAAGCKADLTLWSEDYQLQETLLSGRTVWQRKEAHCNVS